MLAKQVATVDFLSGGRVILGAAAGHMEREFEMLGVPFAERGAITDEYLEAMKVLWTSDAPAYKGRYVQFERIAFEPKPTQKPHPPLDRRELEAGHASCRDVRRWLDSLPHQAEEHAGMP
jgi:alkanesulfonate monooxygenase SsuD/methylene tetrahydromethanopterin reductase-like flavin-dependent oxidoreductase (luciferase family)